MGPQLLSRHLSEACMKGTEVDLIINFITRAVHVHPYHYTLLVIDGHRGKW